MTVLVFDIETVPDVDNGRKILGLNSDCVLTDAEVADALTTLRRQQTGNDFLPLHLQKVVAIAIVLSHGSQVKVWSLGDTDASEAELLQRFYAGIEKYTPTLVSWNGGGFDLPVIHYRSLLHGVSAERYWEIGDKDNTFRYNSYLNRFHYRHIDMMDVLAGYQLRAAAPLNQIATMLGFPGKMGMDGSRVWQCYQEGAIRTIRDYCETDVLNTYLVYLRFELLRNRLSEVGYQEKYQQFLYMLTASKQQHLIEFAAALHR